MPRLIALFEATLLAIAAERLCARGRFPCKAIAVPRALSAGCGIALEFAVDREADLAALFRRGNIHYTLHILE